MKLNTNIPFFYSFLLLVSVCFTATYAQSNKLKVVLDAGHGDGDPGTSGNGLVEKDVALDVVLKIGAILETEVDVEVIYTRKTDVFIGLSERANIANKAKADLFVSVHCNGVASTGPLGFETFVLGTKPNRNDFEQNMDIAMRENSVIYLEDDYEVTYGGFDPESPESYISFELMQEEFLDLSILAASQVQTSVIDHLKRKDRGVKQAPFLVLRETYMPSILVELGFLTNKIDARYLKSEANKKLMANQIAQAIVNYKSDINLVSIEDEMASIRERQADDDKAFTFKVQIAAGSKKIAPSPQNFNGLELVEVVFENEFYKYHFGETKDYMEAQDFLSIAQEKGFDSSFIVAFDANGEKVSVNKALKSKLN
ncbi:N-acetylmuramoyl-L-alanine amidase family protein [Psychroflexus maritimus]|uniref:N-acetylmuramoyl-L-alanine amidase n=1 Tax=Psychroflexus maritimus TaxID=2714865 RepID=A0A967DZZ2_9FLAO|nr:N-acetylmuramoyl-L-alanine amidase [Psychroflexus maritimus]NGZ90723.1 N-acetylmuramoyl-L-alanine amidase [Psychroflexus maritimus]